jgi:hypothetical protein
MGIATAISVAASVAGSLLSSSSQAKAAEKAGDAQGAAALESVALQREMYETGREDYAPWREIGGTAVNQLGALYGIGREGLLSPEEMEEARGMFMETPGYQFRFDEGQRALESSAAARGRLTSGATGRELTRYGQGVASEEFDKYANRLAALSGTGQTATGATANLGAQTAGAAGNALMAGAAGRADAYMAGGTARASGYAGAANAINSGIQNWMFQDMFGTPYGTPPYAG